MHHRAGIVADVVADVGYSMTHPDDSNDTAGVDGEGDPPPIAVDEPVDRPSTQVIEAVAEATDSVQTELQPLYEVIDPDALDSLYSSLDARSTATVTFRYEGCSVTVRTDGETAPTVNVTPE